MCTMVRPSYVGCKKAEANVYGLASYVGCKKAEANVYGLASVLPRRSDYMYLPDS